MKNILRVSETSDLPKYRQLINAVIEGIENGKLKRGQQLPSIAELADAQKTARVTVAKAYEILRENGTILSRHGKGFYVATEAAKARLNIFLLFDAFNAYKEILYQSFKEALPQDTRFSIFFHHYNLSQFEDLIKNNLGKFNFYVIMPHFDQDVSKIIGMIPKDKLLLLDKDVKNLGGEYSAVYQDFENDIFSCLQEGLNSLQKYKSLHLIVGREHFQYVPSGILRGFTKFCKEHKISHSIQDNLSEKFIKQQDVYLIFSDSDLIRFIKHCKKIGWKPGRDIGLISYDDTPLKEVLLNEVTVISTDFKQMGRKAGELIRLRRKERVANPAALIMRKTL